ncbi:PREDICTED: myotubularin-related protein 3 isoform X1 [Ceratosolen solmsi marchali]|uniref:Lateral signaling target protein 2 homolog n=1 Tax=Ceratosolen solmsi marchali TaxID=326594 RepID=A0AAJ6YNK0_9HYME|nr:PREDICTED: myotubularin-related protein 3 isoform X1 [Ceratosolen solmsi marchali]XP_011501348.1 PREDICTED: myotubularin-related protein 3 isoform X1 [Ceratosolen solmsi marchali]XP_011501350.1 PREDICTED: myotubularin-related protein 3 isoform X1 [Ceratosolen solmsi marchali]XP_011501351.1 PREDICTED: myotubularin-related protein 3 isoform X1 [Ceratosolen solmsi marchali]
MESSEEPTSLQSICHLRASELFPKPAYFDFEDSELVVPFVLLSGEYIVALGRTSDGVLALSNYRLYLQLGQGCYNVPLGLIEHLEVKEIFYLHIGCKDARSISCAFSTNEHCLEWFKRLHKVTFPRRSIEDMFTFAYYAWSMEEGKDYPRLGKDNNSYLTTFNSEVERLKFNLHGTWRISQINKDYQMCPSYPPHLLVPACITDKILDDVAKFRSSRRIPAVVWRHVNNGAVIARSSQPEVGWLGWRSSEDEDLLKALSDACSYDRGESTIIDSPVNYSDPGDEPIPAVTTKKVLIVDARSYTTAVANRARGGGCECPEYYPSCDIQFMNLPNIHSIRKSFHAVRQLCASDADQNNWLSLLEGTRWLQHMSGLLRAAVTVASAIERDGRPVLVHCSDGWDRTPQIVALAQILLDPYYRTMEGFQILCEREWLDFGHKFADRCGQTVGCEDPNERCPVFLQWLDCVHQLIKQFKCSFQMSPAYLVKLAQHTYSQLFGTFLCNTRQERLQLRIRERTFSTWRFLNSTSFINHLYSPSKNQVLWPSCNVRDLKLWSAVYLGTVKTPLGLSDIKPRVPMIDIEASENEEPLGQMIKTRSYGDLVQAQDHTTYLHRRLSDPSISIEKKFDSLNLENDADKIETNNDSENFKETDDIIVLIISNEEQLLIKRPVNASVDSSTDTIRPNGDLIIAKQNDEKNLSLIDMATVIRYTCNRNQNEESDASETSVPLISRTPSSICPASPIHQDIMIDNFDRLDDIDGLPVIHCDVQIRVQQIIVENKLKEEALRKELHTTRMALIKQVCNHNTDSERVDDIGSLPDSVGSTGDHGESLPSDMSWEALDEPGPAPTLWVPDHAVNRCMGCDTEFWLGRRKHHCRCCGKIFCADCSENSTPLPNEQLYNPVRVCRDCFSRLHHHISPCQCANRHQTKIVDNEIESIVSPPSLANFSMLPRNPIIQSLGKDDCCESSFQLVQQKQSQSLPIVETSSAN